MTQEQLEGLFFLDAFIESSENQLARIRGLQQLCLSIGQKPPVGLQRLDDEMQKDIERYTKSKETMLNCIALIANEKERHVFEKRYAEHKTWEEIASEMFYTLRYCYIIHRTALSKINLVQISAQG